MAARRQVNSRKLSMQVLEDRTPLAGNIIAGLFGTHLALNGDAADNQVEITEPAPNQIQVTGLGTTTVNGLPFQTFAAPLIEHVTVRTGAGDDSVYIKSLSLTDTANGNLRVSTGSDDDQIRMKGVSTTRSISLFTGDHNDDIHAVRSGTRGVWYTHTSDGHDVVKMEVVWADRMIANMFDGNDSISIEHARLARDLQINTHTENDHVRLQSVSAGDNVHVTLGQGTDSAYLQNVSAGIDVGLDAGSEDDRVTFYKVSAHNNIFATMGAGDDGLRMHTVKAANHIHVNLGSGDDRASIVQAKAHDVYVDAGAGNDRLRMDYVSAVSDLHARLGDGDDVLAISNSSAANPFFNGGPGFDILYDLPNAFDEVLNSANFELII